MPRGKANADSIQGWFREYFRANPQVLDTRSNAVVIDAWMAAHEGKEFGDREKNAMSNVKSNERTRLKKGKGKGKGKKGMAAVAVASSDGAAPKPKMRTGGLEGLEESIDNCLTAARSFGDNNPVFKDVIRYLRAARNKVVWAQGE